MKMKNYILLITLLFTNTVFAQQENLMTKPASGKYTQGSTSGIYIYDDGTFALFGYATLILGNYIIKNNQIAFTPNTPKQAFAILGRENKAIKKGIKLTLGTAFIIDGPTYVKFDDGTLMNIFDKHFISGQPSYTTTLPYHPKIISLAQNTPNSLYRYNTNTFSLEGKYNDFLLYYYRASSPQQPFIASFATENGKSILQSRWGSFEKQTGERDEEWETFLAKNKKQDEENNNLTVFYFNDQLKSATGFDHLSEASPVFDINNYVLDQASNKFIRKDIYKKGTDYLNAVVANYHDESYILSYNKIPISKEILTDFDKIKIAPKALFIYQEKAFKKLVDEPSTEIPATREEPSPEREAPAKVSPPEIKKKN